MRKNKVVFDIPKVEKIGVYCFRNTITKFVYVGSSVNVFLRMKTQERNINTLMVNERIIADIKKYGMKCFEFYVLKTFDDNAITEKELRDCESKYIKYYQKKGISYNINNSWETGKYNKNDLLICPSSYKTFQICIKLDIWGRMQAVGMDAKAVKPLIFAELERRERLAAEDDEPPF